MPARGSSGKVGTRARPAITSVVTPSKLRTKLNRPSKTAARIRNRPTVKFGLHHRYLSERILAGGIGKTAAMLDSTDKQRDEQHDHPGDRLVLNLS